MKSMYVSTLDNKLEMRKDNPEEIYKQPIPLDMINKFVGLDSRILQHDDTVQKQAFDQSYKNFWSFVDFNIQYNDDNPKDLNPCTHIKTKTIKPMSSMTTGKNCSGVHMTYKEAREQANQLLKK